MTDADRRNPFHRTEGAADFGPSFWRKHRQACAQVIREARGGT